MGLFGRRRVKVKIKVPWFVEEASKRLLELMQQAPQVAEELVQLRTPYFEKMRESIEGMEEQLRGLYSELEGKVASLYDTLYQQSQQVVSSEIAKQQQRLGALGLANTQASQWATADILNRISLDVLREKTRALTDIGATGTGTLARAVMMKPSLYGELMELAPALSKSYQEMLLKQSLASSIFGAPFIAQPIHRVSGLQSLLGGLSGGLGLALGGLLGGGIGKIFGSIFGGLFRKLF